MNPLQIEVANAALRKMVRDGYLSICTIDNILKMGEIIPDPEAYDVLRTLHCVNFSDMSPKLIMTLPELLSRVFDSKIGINVTFHKNGEYVDIVTTTPEPQRPSLFRRLVG